MDQQHLKSLMDLNGELIKSINENSSGKSIIDDLTESLEDFYASAFKDEKQLQKASVRLAAIAIRVSVIGNRGDNMCLRGCD